MLTSLPISTSFFLEIAARRYFKIAL